MVFDVEYVYFDLKKHSIKSYLSFELWYVAMPTVLTVFVGSQMKTLRILTDVLPGTTHFSIVRSM